MENPVISSEYVEKNYIHKNKLVQEMERLNNEIKTADPMEAVFKMKQQEILYKILEETEDENNNTFTMQKQEEQSTDSNK